jgi:uncharacterized protein
VVKEVVRAQLRMGIASSPDAGQPAVGRVWYTAPVPELSALQAVLLLAAIVAVAFLYSSVGHGGATGYLAVAALLGLTPSVARPGALWMNCVVAGIAFWRFHRAGFFDARVFGPLAAASVPCAWLGSRLHLDGRSYALVLGAALLAAGWFLGWARTSGSSRVCGDDETGPPVPRPATGPMGRSAVPRALLAGGGLGFLAGLTGIGGGVFLTPLLILLRWTPAKTAGGISALFIVVNSVAGLAGLGREALVWQPVFIGAITLGIVGALLGTQCGVSRWRSAGFRRALALVLWIAAARLILTSQ